MKQLKLGEWRQRFDLALVSPFGTQLEFSKGQWVTGGGEVSISAFTSSDPVGTVSFLCQYPIVITPAVLADLTFVVEAFVLHENVAAVSIEQRYGPDSFELVIEEVRFGQGRTAAEIPPELVKPIRSSVWGSIDVETEAGGDPLSHFQSGMARRGARRAIREGINSRLSVAAYYADQITVAPTAHVVGFRPSVYGSIGAHLYAAIAEHYRVTVEQLARFDKAYQITVPPILALVLDRSASRDDFSKALLATRAEFADLRAAVREAEVRLRAASNIREQIEVLEEIEATRERISEKIAGRKYLERTLVKRVWGTIEELGLFKAFKGDFGDLLRWDEKRMLTSRLFGFIDIWKRALEVAPHRKLLERVFGAHSLDDAAFDRRLKR